MVNIESKREVNSEISSECPETVEESQIIDEKYEDDGGDYLDGTRTVLLKDGTKILEHDDTQHGMYGCFGRAVIKRVTIERNGEVVANAVYNPNEDVGERWDDVVNPDELRKYRKILKDIPLGELEV